MRYLIVSDLHGNLEALQAVQLATRGDYSEVICCGDLVGYGPDPEPVVDWVRANAKIVVRGNHDRVVSGVDDAEMFNESARVAAYWTRGHLGIENLVYLRELAPGPIEVTERLTVLHGSPRDEDEYVTTSWEAEEAFRILSNPISFFGHTHIQGGFLRTEQGLTEILPIHVPKAKTRRVLQLRSDQTYYLNTGSIGQPRDGDSRAAFAIYDTTGFVEFGRCAYDIGATIMKMRKARLPDFLSRRLTVGR